jgi:hypothetical protein
MVSLCVFRAPLHRNSVSRVEEDIEGGAPLMARTVVIRGSICVLHTAERSLELHGAQTTLYDRQ